MRFTAQLVVFALFVRAQSLTTCGQQPQQQGVIVTINNTSGPNSTFQTPVWVGFHNGAFDIYDQG